MIDLRNEIEIKRNEMTCLANKYGLLDNRVLTKSQELDALINEFEKIQRQRKRNKNGSLLGV